jgi:cell division protein FtsN
MLPSSRYAHVPLAVVSLALLLGVIGWLLADRLDLLSPTAPPAPPVVPLAAPAPAEPAARPEAAAAPVPGAPPDAPPPAAPPARPPARTRYALESGPFQSAAAADRFEDRVSELGHATVRFRSQDTARLYVVAATGFASPGDAEQAARQLGRGTVAEIDGEVELVLERLPSLGDAIAATRVLRAQGLDVRVREAVTPVARYVVRYGQFASRADAEALGRELAGQGITSRVVKVR